MIGRALRVLLAVAALAGAAPLKGQEAPPASVLAGLLAEAEESNPELAAAKKAAEAAAARVPQAGALPDPMLGVGIMNFPVADPSLGRDMMTMTTIQVGEQFPWPGKLALREEIAGFHAEAAQWEVERTRQKVLAEVKAVYYQVYFLDRAFDVTGRNERLVGDFAQLTSAKYGVGTGAQPDVLKAQVERTRLEDQIVALREQRTSAVARLNALLGRATDTPLPATELPEAVRVAALERGSGDVRFASASLADVLPEAAGGVAPGIPSVAELQRMALQQNPMIQAHVRRVAAQERAVSLARKAVLPDFNVSLAYSRRPDFGDFVNLTVSVPVPIFSGRKQDQAVLERGAELAQHEARHHAMVNELNAEIASLAAELQRARDQLVLLNDGILPQARTSLSSTTASYQVGRVDFLTLLDSQVTLYRHELDYHRLLADFAKNVAALERAVGTEILR
jgi:cobalt-zinc-cadmium efflux system outer membrane protein